MASGLPEGVQPLAAFDADGTLWAGDIGETAFLRGFHEGVILPSTVEGPVLAWAERWGLELPEEPSLAFPLLCHLCEGERILEQLPAHACLDDARADLYGMQAWAYTGRTALEVEAYGERLFAAGFERTLFSWAPELLAALRERGIEVVIASASHRDLVVPGAARLGIARERVYGSLPRTCPQGTYVPTPGCALYGDAKARVVEEHLAGRGGGKPLLAFGDSVAWTDRALLASALMPVAVRPTGVHLEEAWQRGLRILC